MCRPAVDGGRPEGGELVVLLREFAISAQPRRISTARGGRRALCLAARSHAGGDGEESDMAASDADSEPDPLQQLWAALRADGFSAAQHAGCRLGGVPDTETSLCG